MTMIRLLPVLLTCLLLGVAPAKKTGLFRNSADVGNPKLAGSAQFNKRTKAYTLTGAGYNIWFKRDEFQYLFNELDGDFTATADVEFVGTGVDKHRKVGWMVRESVAEDAAHMSAVVHGDGLTALQWRETKGAAMRDPQDEIFSPEKQTQTIQLVRKGSTFTMSVAKKGGAMQVVGSHDLSALAGDVLVGLFVCSHNPDQLEAATITNVRLNRSR